MIVKTEKEGCLKYQTLVEADRLAWALQQVPGVQTTASLTNAVRQITAGSNEGAPKWLTIARNQDVLNYGAQQASVNNPDLFNTDCSVMPVIAYLSDHRAETLDRVVETSAQFATLHSTPERQFLLAAGSAGIEAATNIVVRKAWVQMLLLVYAAVIALCFVTFRSWRAVVVAVVPLVITSVLCEALMVALGIGVKVATLPVIALGVGIGIDYALYLLSVQLAQQRVGVSLAQAYRSALQFTGKVVVLVGVTLAAGVATWALSPIKFQADMGILLAFMFIWNMVGAVILIPALSHYLLPSGRARPGVGSAPLHEASVGHAEPTRSATALADAGRGLKMRTTACWRPPSILNGSHSPLLTRCATRAEPEATARRVADRFHALSQGRSDRRPVRRRTLDRLRDSIRERPSRHIAREYGSSAAHRHRRRVPRRAALEEASDSDGSPCLEVAGSAYRTSPRDGRAAELGRARRRWPAPDAGPSRQVPVLAKALGLPRTRPRASAARIATKPRRRPRLGNACGLDPATPIVVHRRARRSRRGDEHRAGSATAENARRRGSGCASAPRAASAIVGTSPATSATAAPRRAAAAAGTLSADGRGLPTATAGLASDDAFGGRRSQRPTQARRSNGPNCQCTSTDRHPSTTPASAGSSRAMQPGSARCLESLSREPAPDEAPYSRSWPPEDTAPHRSLARIAALLAARRAALPMPGANGSGMSSIASVLCGADAATSRLRSSSLPAIAMKARIGQHGRSR